MLFDLLLQSITLSNRELGIGVVVCDIDGRLAMGRCDLLRSRDGVIGRCTLGRRDSRGKADGLSSLHTGTGVLGVCESGRAAVGILGCHRERVCGERSG